MMTFMRTIIEVPGSQLQRLDAFCEREAISRAEAIRRAVALYLERECSSNPDTAFGLWRDRTEDSLVLQDRLRREWDRELDW